MALVVLTLALDIRTWLTFDVALHLLFFFVTAMICHGQLSATRPAAAYLTRFYFCMSLGGVLGGIFSGLLAPNVFSWIAEYPILIVAAALARPDMVRPQRREAIVYAALAALDRDRCAARAAAGLCGGTAVQLAGLGLRHRARRRGCAVPRVSVADRARRRRRVRHHPCLSAERAATGNRAQLLRRAQDRGDAGRALPHAAPRHGIARRAAADHRRRQARDRQAGTVDLLSSRVADRRGDRGRAGEEGRSGQHGGDRARRRPRRLSGAAAGPARLLRDRCGRDPHRQRSEALHLHPRLQAGHEDRARRCAADAGGQRRRPATT